MENKVHFLAAQVIASVLEVFERYQEVFSTNLSQVCEEGGLPKDPHSFIFSRIFGSLFRVVYFFTYIQELVCILEREREREREREFTLLFLLLLMSCAAVRWAFFARV
eukprot:snap_masked-scaffold_51-processed-gene-1.43-mRNA-1 protein AED:1.00 eAED:1.00 QI:0/0/0/0/1/1/2/0/107